MCVEGVTVQCELGQLATVFDALDVFKLVYAVVRQEYSLKSRTSLQTRHGVNKVTTQVKLRKGEQTRQIRDICYQIVR